MLSLSSADPLSIDPAALDWRSLSESYFPYRLRQAPGPLNALGRIKFMLPNKFDVYLHDTPSRQLFRQPARLFSSGCIRVADPLALARFALAETAGWDTAAIDQAAASSTQKVVWLDRPLPVHLLYWTSWVEADGEIQFRADVYKRDAPLEQALEEKWASPGASADHQQRTRPISR